jgi:hypothetical protein
MSIWGYNLQISEENSNTRQLNWQTAVTLNRDLPEEKLEDIGHRLGNSSRNLCGD